jgi:hypothetical protein
MEVYGKRQNWFTEASGAKYFGFRKLVDDLGKLSVTFVDDAGRLFRFEWEDFCAYRCIGEEYYMPWLLNKDDLYESSPTHIVQDSQWLAELGLANDLLHILQPNLVHYVIASADYWTEILARTEPLIRHGE